MNATLSIMIDNRFLNSKKNTVNGKKDKKTSADAYLMLDQVDETISSERYWNNKHEIVQSNKIHKARFSSKGQVHIPERLVQIITYH